ncbi:DUF4870 domain-containing protein [bacterium]|nr:DUF4870 domain-containing protein [bacterium]
MAVFNSSEEKTFLAIASLGAIVGFVLPLIMWALKKEEFSEYTKTFLLDVLNFEFVLFIISIVLVLIPILGWLVNLGLFVFNLLVALNAFSAVQEQKEYSFPIKYQLVKNY